MRCDDAQLAVSLRADGEPDATPASELDAHVATCLECRRFSSVVSELRAELRLEPVDRAPDLGPSVVAALADGVPAPPALRPAPSPARRPRPPAERPPRRPGRAAAAVAVAAVAGLVGGAAFVGLDTDPRAPAAADVPGLVVEAQSEVTSLDARYDVVESGGAPTGAVRTFDVRLGYRAPESLSLRVHETTGDGDDGDGPAGESATGTDGTLVVTGDRWWHEATRPCSPAPGLVTCPLRPARWSREVTGRAPFADSAPVPLDLVVPVDAFTLAGAPGGLGQRTIAGRRAVGVSVPAAQVDHLLRGMSSAVELRAVHPADPVDLWLDAEDLIPLGVIVRAGDSPARAAWAAAAGHVDVPGAQVLRVDATEVRIDDPATPVPTIPSGPASLTVDAGFRPDPDEAAANPTPALDPASVPDGFRPDRAGVVTTAGGPLVGVRAWTDGRAWFTVEATAGWAGGRLFGGLGPDVRTLDLGSAGQGYASADGRRVAVHSAGLDVVVSGSLPVDRLAAIAGDLGIVGEPVPAAWSESATATEAEADRALPGRLTLAGLDGIGGLDGFGEAALRVTHDAADAWTVTEVRAGPGARSVSLTQRPGPALPPPVTGDEVGVEVRGTLGRYSVADGELAWTEAGVVCTLRSPALSVTELVTVAEQLGSA